MQVQFLFETDDQVDSHDACWTVQLKVEGRVIAETGVSGDLDDAFSGARDLAIENELLEKEDEH